MSLSREPVVG